MTDIADIIAALLKPRIKDIAQSGDDDFINDNEAGDEARWMVGDLYDAGYVIVSKTELDALREIARLAGIREKLGASR